MANLITVFTAIVHITQESNFWQICCHFKSTVVIWVLGWKRKNRSQWAVVVAQLVEWSFESSHLQILFAINCIENTKRKEKQAGNRPFKKEAKRGRKRPIFLKAWENVFLGRGGGLVVSILAHYYHDSSSKHAKSYIFYCKILFE